MKNNLVTAFIVSVILFSCNSKADKAASDKNEYEKAKESIEEKERKNPVAFLKVDSKDKHNLLGQTVIKGTISNNAKICTYADVEIELSFISKTGTLLEKDKETIYEIVSPGKEVAFKTKYFAPKGTETVNIKVLGATAK
jgi:hypothetical protein